MSPFDGLRLCYAVAFRTEFFDYNFFCNFCQSIIQFTGLAGTWHYAYSSQFEVIAQICSKRLAHDSVICVLYATFDAPVHGSACAPRPIAAIRLRSSTLHALHTSYSNLQYAFSRCMCFGLVISHLYREIEVNYFPNSIHCETIKLLKMHNKTTLNSRSTENGEHIIQTANGPYPYTLWLYRDF